MPTQAEKTAQRLEKLRKRLLDPTVTIILYKAGTTGYATLSTVTAKFYVKRVSNLTLGEEYLEVKIAEQTGIATKAIMRQVIAAKYLDVIYKASVVEQTINAQKVFVLRLTPATLSS